MATHKLTRTQRASLVREYRPIKGETQRLAHKYNISTRTVQYHLRKAGVRKIHGTTEDWFVNYCENHPEVNRNMSRQAKQQLKHAVEGNCRVCGKPAFRAHFCKKHYFHIRKNLGLNKTIQKRLSPEEKTAIISEYQPIKGAVSNLAKKYGVTPPAIIQLLKKFGIKLYSQTI